MDAEFPRIDPRLTGLRHRWVIHAARLSRSHPGFCAVASTDVERGTTEVYAYGGEHVVEEHVFVAEPGSAPGAAGWVLGTTLDLKVALPLGFHGVFFGS